MTYTYDDDLYSDLHKEAHGFRPREFSYRAWNAMSPAEKQEEWDWLLTCVKTAAETAAKAEANSVKDFRVRVEMLMSAGATDRATAIRWLAESMDCLNEDGTIDGGYFCFKMGLPYSMEKEFACISKN